MEQLKLSRALYELIFQYPINNEITNFDFLYTVMQLNDHVLDLNNENLDILMCSTACFNIQNLNNFMLGLDDLTDDLPLRQESKIFIAFLNTRANHMDISRFENNENELENQVNIFLQNLVDGSNNTFWYDNPLCRIQFLQNEIELGITNYVSNQIEIILMILFVIYHFINYCKDIGLNL